MPKIINIAGQARHGKTSVAEILKEVLENRGKRVLIKNYADYLKFICKEYFGWDGTKSAEGRTILQVKGTNIVRKKNPDFWVREVGNFIDVFGDDFDFIIASDCRFRNEAEYFEGKYPVFNIKVIRADFDNGLTPEQKNHPSERDLDNFCFDYILASESGLDNLEQSVSWLVQTLDDVQFID